MYEVLYQTFANCVSKQRWNFDVSTCHMCLFEDNSCLKFRRPDMTASYRRLSDWITILGIFIDWNIIFSSKFYKLCAKLINTNHSIMTKKFGPPA